MSSSVTCVSGAVLILHRRPGKRPAKAAFSPKSEGVVRDGHLMQDQSEQGEPAVLSVE